MIYHFIDSSWVATLEGLSFTFKKASLDVISNPPTLPNNRTLLKVRLKFTSSVSELADKVLFKKYISLRNRELIDSDHEQTSI